MSRKSKSIDELTQEEVEQYRKKAKTDDAIDQIAAELESSPRILARILHHLGYVAWSS